MNFRTQFRRRACPICRDVSVLVGSMHSKHTYLLFEHERNIRFADHTRQMAYAKAMLKLMQDTGSVTTTAEPTLPVVLF